MKISLDKQDKMHYINISNHYCFYLSQINDFVLKAPMKQNGCKQLYYLFIVSIKHEIKNLF